MNPEKLAFINLVTRLGFTAAAIVWKNVTQSKTIDEAIAALEKSEQLTAADYARERQP